MAGDVRHPDRPEVQEFRGAHAESVDFHGWLQWLLDEQLAAAQLAARNAGMTLGIMHDLAVGVHPTRRRLLGAAGHAWRVASTSGRRRTRSTSSARTGASHPGGRTGWPRLGYAPYRDLIAGCCGMRARCAIDHIIGLFRLWWIPTGETAGRGTYVGYDHEALIGILALEVHRAGALVVGEDLGNVEPGGSRVPRGTWHRGHVAVVVRARRRRQAAAGRAVAGVLPGLGRRRHDLPPTAGYLAGDHVSLRERLGLFTRSVEEERATDEADRAAVLDLLREEGLVSASASTEEIVTGLHEYLTRTPSRLVCVR